MGNNTPDYTDNLFFNNVIIDRNEVFNFFELENKVKECAKNFIEKEGTILRIKNAGQGMISIHYIIDSDEIYQKDIPIKEFCGE